MTHPNQPTGETTSVLDVARTLESAVIEGDLEKVRRVYSPEALVWQNFNGAERGVEDVIRGIVRLHQCVDDLRYSDVVTQETTTGYVQQHVLEGTVRATGVSFSHPVCLIVRVRDGKIARIDEYGDASHAPRLPDEPGGTDQ
jgi:ketosteroid isomerase-like protein